MKRWGSDQVSAPAVALIESAELPSQGEPLEHLIHARGQLRQLNAGDSPENGLTRVQQGVAGKRERSGITSRDARGSLSATHSEPF
ncbi:hypothetical protein [Pseudomonas sp. RC10]|uniref:hypothetical protein n=1 Tax=Pseudomonas bambusae TaxID=3139142 RepID=UPI003138EE59